MIKEITLPNEPTRNTGGRPDGIFIGDPDMGASHKEAGKVTELFEACKPVFKGTPTGKMLVFGTPGSVFGKAKSPDQEEVFELFENIMIDGQ